MSILVPINGVNYIIPTPGETGWGSNLDSFFVAISSGTLQKNGGSFLLSNEVDFGAAFGLKSLYYKAEAGTVATTGTLRLASADPGVVFRNNANSGNLVLTTNSSDQLLFNGTPIGGSGIFTASRAVVTDSSGNLTTAATTAAEIGFVNGVTSAIQTQLNAKANDNAVVHLAGTETITGIKNFTANPTVILGTAELLIKGTTASSEGSLYVQNDVAHGPQLYAFGSTNASTINGRAAADLAAVASDKSLFVYTQGASTFISLGINAAEQVFIASTGMTLTNPLGVPSGGTGAGSHTAYALLAGGTTSTGALQSIAGVGSSGQVLTSNGPAALPTFQNVAGTGTVNSGTQFQLAYYATSTNAVSGLTLITASKALASDANGLPVASTTTATELGFVAGVTSAIQTQLNAKATDSLVVHLAGTETITGLKTFSQLIRVGTLGTDVSLANAATVDVVGSGNGFAANNTATAVASWSGDVVIYAGNNGTTQTERIRIANGGLTTFKGNLAFNSTSTQGIVGTTTNNNAASGNVGETLSSSVTGVTGGASGVFSDLTSISLTAGDWLLTGIGAITNFGASTTDVTLGISTTTGNSSAGLTVGDTQTEISSGSTLAFTTFTCTVPSVRFSLSTTTVLYLKIRTTAVSASTWNGRLSAVRIR